MALTLAERFWSKVAIGGPDECWPWTACTSDDGYGLFRLDGRLVRAHRVALRLSGTDIPDHLDGLHSCHNTGCSNPRHLRAGTPTENAADARAAGRMSAGERHPASKLSAAQVTEIRSLRGQRSQRALANIYNVSRGAIEKIHGGLTWKDVPQWP